MSRDLSKANQILSKLASQNPNITPVTIDDSELFQSFFDKEPHTYGNSWTYVTQGVYGTGPNNLGYKYYDGKNLSMITVYPKIEQPDIHAMYWIRPMGPTITDKIASIAKKVKEKYKSPTYAKKLFKNQYDQLISQGFSDIINFPWHSSCTAEDDTYPEQIFNIKETLSRLNSEPRKSSFREMYRRAQRLEKNNQIQISQNQFQIVAPKIAKSFFEMDTITNSNKNFSHKEDYFNPIQNNPKRKSLIQKIVHINNKPLAFYILEKQTSEYSSLYAQLIIREKIKNLADYLFFHIFNTTNTKFLNLGGSEDDGIRQFKEKYKPSKYQQMYWATNRN